MAGIPGGRPVMTIPLHRRPDGHATCQSCMRIAMFKTAVSAAAHLHEEQQRIAKILRRAADEIRDERARRS
jgi:hypothetical protein